MNEEKSLIDYCHVDKNDDGDRFVGLKSIDDNGHQVVMVYFPCGYNLPSDEIGIRNDIINLFRILADFSKGEDILLKVKSNVANVSVNFPIKAYLDIIQYYLDYGTFYAETETTFKTDTRGKTDWPKTIKNQVHYLLDPGFPFRQYLCERSDAASCLDRLRRRAAGPWGSAERLCPGGGAGAAPGGIRAAGEADGDGGGVGAAGRVCVHWRHHRLCGAGDSPHGAPGAGAGPPASAARVAAGGGGVPAAGRPGGTDAAQPH